MSSRRRYLKYTAAGIAVIAGAAAGAHFGASRHRGSQEGLAAYRAAYDTTLTLWPVPYTELDIETRFGSTHVIASGSKDAPPLVLLHPNSTSSTVWFPNIALWSSQFRCYAVDTIGEPGKSVATHVPQNRNECAEWLQAVFDSLEVDGAPIVGGSYGGFQTTNFALKKPERVTMIALLAANGYTEFNARFNLLAFGSYLFPFDPLLKPFFGEFCYKEPNELFFKQLISSIKYVNPQIAFSVPPTVFSDEELQSLRTPLLYLMGDKEVIYNNPHSVIERVEQLVPNGVAEMVPDAGHLPNHDRPEIINNRILDFLTQ
jgi:pimeloyl-ACP methyl ester carboxylesterase